MKLDRDSSIRSAELLYTALESEYANGCDLSLDASEVDRIDTTVFQIIVALKARLESENIHLNITEPSAEFIRSAELLGLAEFLDIPTNSN